MNRYGDILGHDRPKDILRRAARGGRVHHAYLFSGPEGVGKWLVARAFAAALDCEHPENGEACGRCLACRKMADENHPDLKLVLPVDKDDKADLERGKIKIEQVRDLQRWAQFSPYEGKWKVALLRSADRMNVQSANAMLKTLEEPRPDSVFVLVAENAHQLPATVLSRCQNLAFGPLALEIVEQQLVQRLGMEPDAARLAAHLSGGSLGRALDMNMESLSERRLRVFERLQGISGAGPTRALDLAQVLLEGDPATSCEIVKTWYRDLVILKTTGHGDAVVNRDMMEQLEGEAAGLDADALFSRIKAIGETQFWLGLNANRQMAIETLALTLAA